MLRRLDTLYQCYGEGEHTVFLFWENELQSMNTIVFIGLLSLKDKFPLLYDSYMNGGFVMNTTKKGIGVPFDQALEQYYKWPAKVSGG